MKREIECDSDLNQTTQLEKKRKVEEGKFKIDLIKFKFLLKLPNFSDHEEEFVDIKKLRDRLRNGNFYDGKFYKNTISQFLHKIHLLLDLKLFLKSASKTPDIITEYVALGGKPLEIVEIIKNHEESGIETISLLYQFLKLLISNIVDERNESKQKVAIDALKCLIRKSKASVNKMLLSSAISDKVTALEILSFGVSIDREIGIEILKNVDLFSKSDEKLSLSAQLFGESKVSSQDLISVRNAFTNMMMEFMMRSEEDIILCKRVVQKRSLFEFFVDSIQRDSCDTIIDILACLTKRVLLSSVFSKPEKLKVFTDEAIKSLLKLYEFKNGDADEKSKVVSVAHEFLVLLLANKKYGIVFKALSEKRQNLRQLHVIGLFKNVWMLEYPSMLTIEIIKACPELMQNVLNRLAVGLQPKVTTHWFMCANFTKLLIEALEPNEMIKQFSMLEPKKISANIIRMSISQFILQNLRENALLQQDSLEIRENAVQILVLMLQKCCKYIKLINSLENLKDFERHRIKFDIINHIFTFYPHIDMILNSLYRSINLSKRNFNENDEVIKSQMKNTLEILLLTVQYFPSVVEKIPCVIDFLDVLRPIYESNLKNEVDIEVNVTKVILYLQPNLLSAKPELFQRVFIMLIRMLSQERSNSEAKNLLMNILRYKFSFLEKNPFEAIIWMEAFKSLTTNVIKDAATAFLNALEISNNEVLILENLLKQNQSKLTKICEFIETAAILLYHTYPERRKSILTALKESGIEFDNNIIQYLKKKREFSEISERKSFTIFGELKNSIESGVELKILNLKDENQYLLINIHIIHFAMKEKDLSDISVEHLTKLAQKVFVQMENFDRSNKVEDGVEIEEENETIVNKIMRVKNISLVGLSAKYIFEIHEGLLDKFSLNDKSLQQITKFTSNLAEVYKTVNNFNEICTKYRAKIVAELEQSEFKDVLEIVEKFPLDEHQCCEVFDSCLKMNSNLINFILKRLIEINGKSLDSKQMKILEEKYLKAIINDDENLTTLEGTILEYLRTFPHTIADLSTKIFAKGCEEDSIITRKSFLTLLIAIFKSKRECDEIFKSKIKNMRKEVVYPLLSIALEQNILPQNESRSLFQKEFKAGILKTIERPKRAAVMYRDYLSTSLKLIDIVMTASECCDIALKKFKFDGSEFYQLKMLEAIFVKAIDHKNEASEFEDSKIIFVNFINHWLALVNVAEENLDYFEVLSSWLIKNLQIVTNQVEVNHENLKVAYKIGLKNGLKNQLNSKLLITLALLLKSIDVEENSIGEMFDMLITHSNFFMTAFNTKTSGIKWKTSLFYLFEVLLKKNPKLASVKHIPILLSSYNASMSSCDQLILNLLKFYEFECSIDLFEFRPLIFGAAALSHYSKDRNEEEKTLDGKNVAFHKLASQFEKSLIENTINNYPIKVREDFDVAMFLSGQNNEEYLSKIYDPLFFLPLFEMLLGTDSFDFTSVGIKNNLLPLIVPAFSCEDEKVRLMAARILLNCREITSGKK